MADDKRKPQNKKRNNQKGAPKWLIDPRVERDDEKIGGGHFVFRRTSGTGRIRVPEWPFEHPTYEAALSERNRLMELYEGEKFVVVSEIK